MAEHETTPTPLTVCWHCDRPLDAATDLEGQESPTPGAISLCMYCGAVAVFGPGLILMPPTKELLDDLQEDKEFRQNYLAFSWARQYIMLNSNLMRDREDLDR